MKNIIKKSITTIIIMALALTLAMPVTAQAAKKKAPKISKTKVTMTITKKKTKPTVQLKVKNVSAKKVKWATSNKKVVTVSKNGKVVAKKKGSAVITVKVKGSKTLRCKVTVKDNRKPVTKPNPNPAPNPPVETECQHNWVEGKEVVGYAIMCSCGQTFDNDVDWTIHNDEVTEKTGERHSCGSTKIYGTYLYCSKCKIRK